MSDKCIYCSRRSRKRVTAGDGQYVCESCANKSQEYLTKLLRLWKPNLADAILPEPKPTETETKEQKKDKKMKQFNIFTLAGFLAIGVFAGATVRCDVDDDKDKDKAKSAFVDVHGHAVQEAVSEAMPGALVDFGDPDYECIAIGSIDRDGDTDFDVLFITGCHRH